MKYPRYIAGWPGVIIKVRNEREHRAAVRTNLWSAGLYVAAIMGMMGWLAYTW